MSVRCSVSREFHVNNGVLTDLIAESIAQGSELNHWRPPATLVIMHDVRHHLHEKYRSDATIILVIYHRDNICFIVSIDRLNNVRMNWDWEQIVSETTIPTAIQLNILFACTNKQLYNDQKSSKFNIMHRLKYCPDDININGNCY